MVLLDGLTRWSYWMMLLVYAPGLRDATNGYRKPEYGAKVVVCWSSTRRLALIQWC